MRIERGDPTTKARLTDVYDLSEHGVLWYINRVALHPRGLALAINEDGSFELWAEGEPWSFTPEIDKIKFERFEQLVRWLQGEAHPDE